ncbi:AMP-binding protein [Gemmobacter lanyuensis]
MKTLLLGGEALPGAFVRELRRVTQARILNMYGPTETTIWSTVEEAGGMRASAISAPLSPIRRSMCWTTSSNPCRPVWRASCGSAAMA